MAVRRKSNWYIYFIAFGITLAMIIMAIVSFRDFLFPKSAETGLTADGELTSDFVPDSSMNMAVMTMISDGENDMPELFIIAAFDAVENRLTFIPVDNGIALAATGRTLPNIYAAQGGSGVAETVGEQCGIKLDGYIRFTRSSLVALITTYGNVEFEVPKTLMITDGNEVTTINSGDQILTADMIYSYLMFADFGESEDYRWNMICSQLIELVNQNITFVDSSLLDIYAGEIMEGAETDISQELYLSKKAAMLNTVQYGINPAEYYVPYGEYGEDGSFTIAENSVVTIRQKSGQEE